MTEGRNFKTFLKENYAIALNSCYLFNKKMLNMKMRMIFLVLKKFTNIRHCWTLQ